MASRPRNFQLRTIVVCPGLLGSIPKLFSIVARPSSENPSPSVFFSSLFFPSRNLNPSRLCPGVRRLTLNPVPGPIHCFYFLKTSPLRVGFEIESFSSESTRERTKLPRGAFVNSLPWPPPETFISITRYRFPFHWRQCRLLWFSCTPFSHLPPNRSRRWTSIISSHLRS